MKPFQTRYPLRVVLQEQFDFLLAHAFDIHPELEADCDHCERVALMELALLRPFRTTFYPPRPKPPKPRK